MVYLLVGPFLTMKTTKKDLESSPQHPARPCLRFKPSFALPLPVAAKVA
jgi:hypothetical protein